MLSKLGVNGQRLPFAFFVQLLMASEALSSFVTILPKYENYSILNITFIQLQIFNYAII
jgi:hypothetical protein